MILDFNEPWVYKKESDDEQDNMGGKLRNRFLYIGISPNRTSRRGSSNRYGDHGVDADVHGLGVVDGAWIGDVLRGISADEKCAGYHDAQFCGDGDHRGIVGCVRLCDVLR